MTRMWMVNPKIMCRNHLLGEHKEIHQLIGAINKKFKLDGYVKNNCIEITNIRQRHDELVIEMLKRNYNHKSEIKEYDCGYLDEKIVKYKIDKEKSLEDLLCRCKKCKEVK